MAPTATITTTVPLAPNLANADITLSAIVSAFSAFDGLTTYNYNAHDDLPCPRTTRWCAYTKSASPPTRRAS